MSFFVYIIRTDNNKLYIGQTNNLSNRIVRHRDGNGARFLKQNGASFEVAYFEEYEARVKAMRREKQLKGWTRAKKEALIVGDIDLLKRL